MIIPLLIEKHADNGAHTHYAVVDKDTGETLWEESKTDGIERIEVMANAEQNHETIMTVLKQQETILEMHRSMVASACLICSVVTKEMPDISSDGILTVSEVSKHREKP